MSDVAPGPAAAGPPVHPQAGTPAEPPGPTAPVDAEAAGSPAAPPPVAAAPRAQAPAPADAATKPQPAEGVPVGPAAPDGPAPSAGPRAAAAAPVPVAPQPSQARPAEPEAQAPSAEPEAQVPPVAEAAAPAPPAGLPGFPAYPGADPQVLPPAAPADRPPRRKLALGIAAALVAVAACGGVGYEVLRDDGGDAAKSAAPWTEPTPTATKALGARSGGAHYGSPRLLLLPIPAGYSPGPDVDGYGNDVALDSRQAAQLVKSQYRHLPAKQREAMAKSVDRLRVESAGLRTYTQAGGRLVIQTRIVQVGNQAAARTAADEFRAFAHEGAFQGGPKVKGYPKATCLLLPAAEDEIDSMICQATEGDLQVVFTADGPNPLEKSDAVDLLRKQLDRIKDPGEVV